MSEYYTTLIRVTIIIFIYDTNKTLLKIKSVRFVFKKIVFHYRKKNLFVSLSKKKIPDFGLQSLAALM